MSEAKPPVAIRITRPYQSEDELLAKELDTISRTGVVLVGAQPRPEGAILRFELALASGVPLLRGEGRVIAHKPSVMGNEPGLAVRFTRLDSKSKALVDRVTALREKRRSGAPPPPPAPAPPATMPSLPDVSEVQQPTASAASPAAAQSSDLMPAAAISSDALPVSPPTPESSPQLAAPKPASRADSGPQLQDREAVLARLRERAAGISADRLNDILTAGASRRRPA